jgi:hypothetical protein
MMKSVGKKFTERILFAGDTSCDPAKVQTVLLTAGKHYYTLNEKREFLGVKNVAIVRLESYCPFPTLQLQQEVAKFPNAKCKSFFFFNFLTSVLFSVHVVSGRTAKYGCVELRETAIRKFSREKGKAEQNLAVFTFSYCRFGTAADRLKLPPLSGWVPYTSNNSSI